MQKFKKEYFSIFSCLFVKSIIFGHNFAIIFILLFQMRNYLFITGIAAFFLLSVSTTILDSTPYPPTTVTQGLLLTHLQQLSKLFQKYDDGNQLLSEGEFRNLVISEKISYIYQHPFQRIMHSLLKSCQSLNNEVNLECYASFIALQAMILNEITRPKIDQLLLRNPLSSHGSLNVEYFLISDFWIHTAGIVKTYTEYDTLGFQYMSRQDLQSLIMKENLYNILRQPLNSLIISIDYNFNYRYQFEEYAELIRKAIVNMAGK